MNLADAIQRDRAFVEHWGLYGFLRVAWPLIEPAAPYTDNWHIAEKCLHLQKISEGLLRDLVINEPPSCTKSIVCDIAWPAWTWIKQPTKKWIYMTYDQGMSCAFARRTRELVNSPWYQARWPGVEITGRADGEYWNTAGGYRFSGSIGGEGTGKHANIVVVDDPIKAQDTMGVKAITRSGLDKVLEWWHGVMPTRMADPKTHSKCIIMQRLHEEDLSGHVLRTSPVPVAHLRMPMRYEANNPCVTPWGGDRRTVDGELLWPARFGEAEVSRLETELGYQAAGQLQQRPSAEGGEIVKKDWIKYWGVDGRPFPHEREIIEWITSWDMTFKDTPGTDYVCGQVWVRTVAGYFLVDRVYQRLDFDGTCEAFKAQCAQYPQARAKLIEDKANGPAVVSHLKNKITGIIERPAPAMGKLGRVHACCPLYRAGNVFYPNPDIPGKGWVREHVEDMTGFPARKHDDTVDAETQALLYFEESGNPFLEALKGQANAANKAT